MIGINGKSIGGVMTDGKVLSMIMTAGKVIWQAIRALFFTKDGFYIETKDGKIFDMKQ